MCYINLEIGVIDNKSKKNHYNQLSTFGFFFLSNGSFCKILKKKKKNQDNRQFSGGFAI